MSKKLIATIAVIILSAASLPNPSIAAVEDLPGMDTAANMKEWLKLTDDQVAKLKPIIATRIQKTDAALEKVEAAERPDMVGFIEQYGAIKKEFNTGIAGVLTPEQLKQLASFKAALEKDMVQSAAKKELAELQTALNLTADQVTKLQPAMATAIQKKLDLLQKLVDSGRISIREKIQAKRAINDINSDLAKAMSAVLSPDQMAAYKAATK